MASAVAAGDEMNVARGWPECALKQKTASVRGILQSFSRCGARQWRSSQGCRSDDLRLFDLLSGQKLVQFTARAK